MDEIRAVLGNHPPLSSHPLPGPYPWLAQLPHMGWFCVYSTPPLRLDVGGGGTCSVLAQEGSPRRGIMGQIPPSEPGVWLFNPSGCFYSLAAAVSGCPRQSGGRSGEAV